MTASRMESILSLYESNAPGSGLHTSTSASEYAKMNEAQYVLATSNNISYVSTTGRKGQANSCIL